MIFDLFRNGFTLDVLINLCARLFVLFCILPIHEFAHAFVATKLGDQTARLSGRLTLNPLAHIDPFGALLIIIAGFGYAKPVPVNPHSFKMDNKKAGMALTALAGPVSNLIMAFIFMVFYCAVFKFTNVVSGSFAYAVAYFFMYASSINISLAVFNLIPVPPLDGSRILRLIIPDRYYYKYARYERYFVYAILVLVLIGVLDIPISLASSALSDLFLKGAAAIFGLSVA